MTMLDSALPIVTDRLVLRRPARADMPAWAALNHALASSGHGVEPLPPSAEAAWENLIAAYRQPWDNLAVELAATGEFIGSCGLLGTVKEWPCPEVYCWLGEEHQGRGFGREVVDWLSSAAFGRAFETVRPARRFRVTFVAFFAILRGLCLPNILRDCREKRPEVSRYLHFDVRVRRARRHVLSP